LPSVGLPAAAGTLSNIEHIFKIFPKFISHFSIIFPSFF
jgi:hypothetical protein